MNLPAINRQRLLDRFLQYVRIGSTANPNTNDYPSSRGQWILGQLLVTQLLEMGVSDAHQDDFGLIWGTLPSNIDSNNNEPNSNEPGNNESGDNRRIVPTILLNAHLDTSPEAPGDHCKPQVIENYAGGPVVLPNGETIDETTTPELKDMIGHLLVTTDGTTLLGADDKAGVAAIMECAHYLLENPQIKHGPVRILFTCDEEIGRGTKHVDLEKANAVAGYTLDGGGIGTIDVETFSADMATVRFIGQNTHPSIGKGRMINALRGASLFVASFPTDSLSPETTCDRQGFIHPYTMTAAVGATTVQLILRDFDTAKLSQYAELIRAKMDEVCRQLPGLKAELEITVQYRNMADGLRKFPKAISIAEEAFRQLGITCRRDSIRGGTDGALMTEMGLPTPNLSVGQFNIHSVREFCSMNYVESSIRQVVAMLQLWASDK